MSHEIDLLAYLEKVEPSDEMVGIVGYFQVRSEDLENHEWLYYSHGLFPQNAHYRWADFAITITVRDHPSQVTRDVGEDESLVAFEAECINAGEWEDTYQLWGTDAGRPLGRIKLLPERLPAWLGDEGDRCYMTVHMEYQPGDMSEEELREARETLQRKYESLEERFDL